MQAVLIRTNGRPRTSESLSISALLRSAPTENQTRGPSTGLIVTQKKKRVFFAAIVLFSVSRLSWRLAFDEQIQISGHENVVCFTDHVFFLTSFFSISRSASFDLVLQTRRKKNSAHTMP